MSPTSYQAAPPRTGKSPASYRAVPYARKARSDAEHTGAEIEQSVGEQAEDEQSQRVRADDDAHVGGRLQWRLVGGFREVHVPNDADVVVRADDREQDADRREPDEPGIDHGAEHDELGVEAYERGHAGH